MRVTGGKLHGVELRVGITLMGGEARHGANPVTLVEFVVESLVVVVVNLITFLVNPHQHLDGVAFAWQL